MMKKMIVLSLMAALSVMSVSTVKAKHHSSSSSSEEEKEIAHEIRKINSLLAQNNQGLRHLDHELDKIRKLACDAQGDVHDIRDVVACLDSQVDCILQTVNCLVTALVALVNDLNLAQIVSLELPLRVLNGQLTETLAALAACEYGATLCPTTPCA